MIFDMEKTRMVKKFDDMSSRLGTILCDRQTDRQTLVTAYILRYA